MERAKLMEQCTELLYLPISKSKLPEPVFTPSTKAEDGLHDENISFTQVSDIVGLEIAELAKQNRWNSIHKGPNMR